MSNLKSEINWDILTQPIFDGEMSVGSNGLISRDNQIKGFNSIRRNDNQSVLHVTQDTYHPMTIESFTERVESISRASGFPILGYDDTFKGGKIILAYLENKSESFKIGDHTIKDYLVVGTSFDGSKAFFVGTTTVLLRCTNQFSSVAKLVKVRHTKHMNKRIDEADTYLNSYLNNREKMYEKFNRYGNVQIDDEVKEQLANFLLNIKETDTLEEISTKKINQKSVLINAINKETKEIGNNLWGLFNGVTWYTTHDLEQKNETFGNMFDTKGRLNDNAIKFCDSVLKTQEA